MRLLHLQYVNARLGTSSQRLQITVQPPVSARY
jgi:hypothetical protein